MLTHIETVKFAGRAAPKINTQNGNVEYEWDDLSTIGKTLSEIANDPNIPEDKQQEIMRSFPAIFRALMNKSSQVESPIFSWFRQFTYLSLLVSPPPAPAPCAAPMPPPPPPNRSDCRKN